LVSQPFCPLGSIGLFCPRTGLRGGRESMVYKLVREIECGEEPKAGTI